MGNSDNLNGKKSLTHKICLALLFLGAIMIQNRVQAQLAVNNTLYTPAQLVTDVLLGGGVAVSNVQFKGVVNSSGKYQIGYFSSSGTTLTQLGFSSGIVMTTGYTSSIPGSVSQISGTYPSCTTGEIRKGGTCAAPAIVANDIQILCGTGTNWGNVAILEFDFVPTSDSVQFRYVFSSTEYDDPSHFINYNCSDYNDHFGFLLSGPGISGGSGYTNDAKNIALLPGTNLPVCINAVNNGIVGSSGGAPNASKCQAANPAWVQNTPTNTFNGIISGIAFNGNTKIFTAKAQVQACQTYHIKMIVADVSDYAYDSGVFLEAKSFFSESVSTVSQAESPNSTLTLDSNITEACTKGHLTFKLNHIATVATTINYTIGGTATNGTDYDNGSGSPLSGTVTIPVGSDSAVVIINPLADGSTEGNETITITYTFGTGCSGSATKTLTYFIHDNTTPSVTTNSPLTTCSGNPVTMTATGSSGTTPYSYVWSNSAGSTNSVSVSPATTTTYTVTLTDACLNTTTSTVTVDVTSAPTITSVTPGSNCGTGTVTLGAVSSFGTINWYANASGGTSLGSGTSFTTPSISVTTTYYVEATASGCPASSRVPVTATINSTPSISTTSSASICGTGTVTLGATASAGTINWYAASSGGVSLGTGNSFTTPSISSTTTYYVDATNGGCTTATRTPVVATVNPVPTITSVTGNAICNSGTVTLSATASAGTINWYISNTGGTAIATGNSYTTTSLTSTTTYYVDATSNGCTTSTRTPVTATINPNPIVNLGNDTSICSGTTLVLDAGNIGSTYSWSDLSTNQTLSVNAAGTYSVTVTTAAGCTANDSRTITVNPLPNASVTPSNTAVCNGNQATLTASGGSSYVWSTTPQQVTASISVSPTTTTTYTVTVSNSCGSQTSSATVTVNTITATITPTLSTVCQGQSTTLTASGGTNYVWNTTETTNFIVVSPLVNTTYTVTVSSGSCTATQSIQVDVHNAITATATPSAVCVGESTTLTVSGGTSYQWMDSTQTTTLSLLQTITVSPTDTTSYYAIASDGGCSDTVLVTVIVHSLPTLELGADTSVCTGNSVILDALNSGSTYLWSDSTLNQTLTATTTGFYSVTVTNSFGCDATDNIQVTVNAIPSILNVTPGSRCDAGSVVLNASASTGTVNWYSAATGGSSLNTGNTFNTPVISSTTTYYVDATSNGCTTGSRTPVTATINTTPSIISVVNDTLCDSGILTLSATSSAGIINWYSSPTGGISINSGVNYSTSVLSTTTTYYVDATENGCTTATRTPVLAVINYTPVITNSATDSICDSGTITLSASSNIGTIEWYSSLSGGPVLQTGSTFTTPIITANTTYYIEATNNGCTTDPRIPITAIVNYTPSILTVTPDSACDQGSISLSATSSTGTINWYTTSTGGSSISTGNSFVTPLLSTSTIYYVGAENNGCITATRVPVTATINSTPEILSVFPDSACDSGTLSLTANSSGGTIQWYNVPTGGIAINTGNLFTTASLSTTTTYYVDANYHGCITSTRTPVSAIINTTPQILSVEQDSACGSGSLSLSATASGGTISWYSSATGGIVLQTGSYYFPTINTTTTYYVEATNNGCTTATRTPVTGIIHLLPTVTATTSASSVCEGTQITLTGGGALTFLWSNGVSDGIAFDPISSATYFVTGTDAYGCTDTAAIHVTVNPIPTITSTIPAARCSTGVVTLGATASAGTISWYSSISGGTALGTGTSYTTQSISNTTTYYVEVIASGCTSAVRLPVIATINPLPTVNFPSFSNGYCLDYSSFNLNAATPSGGTYSGPGVSGNIFTAINAGAGTHIITYLYQDNNNCINTDTSQITVFPLPAASAGNQDTLCSGENIILQGTGGTQYSWSGPNGFTSSLQNPTVSPTVTSVYTVTVTDNNNCSQAATVAILVVPSPTASAGADDAICANENNYELVSASANYQQITWTRSGNGVFNNSHAMRPIYTMGTQDFATGFVWLKISVTSDCGIASDSLKLTINPLPNIQTTDTIRIIAGGSSQLSASGGISYSWFPQDDYITNPNSQTPVINPIISTYYIVKGTDSRGCYNYDTVQVIIDADNNIFVPSAFSPWGNNEHNKKLYVFGRGIQNISFMVFDRWGEKVFETKTMETDEHSEGWDGIYKGSPMNPAVFVWYLSVSFYNGDRFEKSGNVTLVR